MIFNKNGAGASEMKELIGFIYKSINFNNLATFISFAERDLKKVIGLEVWAQAFAHYWSNAVPPNPPAEGDDVTPVEQINDPGTEPAPPITWGRYIFLNELVKKVQLPVAIHAYRRYVPGADLSHSDKGRQIFVSEQEKPAFEWMIEKDNQNLLALASEATDNLLEWLDENIATNESDGPPFLTWGSSQAFVERKRLFISTAEQFDSVISIGRSRLTFLALAPFIKRTQEIEIRSCFTEEKFAELKDQHAAGEFSDANKPLFELLVQPLALLALSNAVKRLSSEVLPDGIFNNAISNVIREKRVTTKLDRNEISLSLEKDGLRELAKLQLFLQKQAQALLGLPPVSADPSERIDETKLFVQL
ncbi:MAG: DUF6712 family protein [Bacteroidales bacterium]